MTGGCAPFVEERAHRGGIERAIRIVLVQPECVVAVERKPLEVPSWRGSGRRLGRGCVAAELQQMLAAPAVRDDFDDIGESGSALYRRAAHKLRPRRICVVDVTIRRFARNRLRDRVIDAGGDARALRKQFEKAISVCRVSA